MISSTLNLIAESGQGKLYDTGDQSIYVCQLKGSWYEMGQQYGTFAKDKVQSLYDYLVQPVIDKGWMTEKEARQTFGTRVFESSSLRIQQFYTGWAEAMNWPIEKVVLLDQSGMLGIYQGKLHAFSGCTSLIACGDASKNGHTITGRNLDWGEKFCELPLFFTTYSPNDGSNQVANINWVGWAWAQSALNDKGVYVDMHDGTSMGGQVISTQRPSAANRILDWIVESPSAQSIGNRFNGTLTDVPFIWGVADKNNNCFSYECALHDSRLKGSDNGSTIVICNTFLNPDWGIEKRNTVSNSLTRYQNLTDRASEANGTFDAEKMMEIFDLRLFNEDGTFKENGGATKPTMQDVDLTNYQIVTNLNTLNVWLKIPQEGKGGWRHIDLNQLFD